MTTDVGLFSYSYSVVHDELRCAHLAHLAAILAMYRVDLVLDVGAHIGEFGSAVRTLGYSGWIASFEPVREYARELQANANTDPRWLTREVALGTRTGTDTMYISPGTGSSMLQPNAYGAERFPDLRTIRRQEVSVMRLDDVLRELAPKVAPKRIFLKLDTQGTDLPQARYTRI